MFSRVFVAALVALPAIVSAVPTSSGPNGQCDVGEIHCCDQTQQVTPGVATAAGLLGIPLNLDAILGFNCNPIPVLGGGTNNCAAQPVCCEQNSFVGFINALNCSPVNVNL